MKANEENDLKILLDKIKNYFTLTKQNIVPKLTYWFTILLVLSLVFALNYELNNNEKFRKTFVCEENKTLNNVIKIDDNFIMDKKKEISCSENLKNLTKDANNLMNLTLIYMTGVFLFDKWQEHKQKKSNQIISP
jgi:hypothetical protein